MEKTNEGLKMMYSAPKYTRWNGDYHRTYYRVGGGKGYADCDTKDCRGSNTKAAFQNDAEALADEIKKDCPKY